MKPYVKKVFTGQIVDILEKNTSTGKYLVEFRARTEEGKLYLCTIWEKDAERFNSSVKIGDKIHLEGVEKSEGELSIKYFKGDDIGGGRKFSGPSPDMVRAYREKKRAEGFEFVLTPIECGFSTKFITLAKPRKYCVKVNGVWEGQVEYAMRILGGAFVTDALRDFGDPKFPGTLVNNINPIKFNQILSDLVGLAANSVGDFLEFDNLPEAGSKPVVMEENDLDNMGTYTEINGDYIDLVERDKI